MKTIYPDNPCNTYNEWIVHIYQLLNYPINDDGTKRTATQGTHSQIGIGQNPKSVRTSQQNRTTEKTNRRGKT